MLTATGDSFTPPMDAGVGVVGGAQGVDIPGSDIDYESTTISIAPKSILDQTDVRERTDDNNEIIIYHADKTFWSSDFFKGNPLVYNTKLFLNNRFTGGFYASNTIETAKAEVKYWRYVTAWAFNERANIRYLTEDEISQQYEKLGYGHDLEWRGNEFTHTLINKKNLEFIREQIEIQGYNVIAYPSQANPGGINYVFFDMSLIEPRGIVSQR